MLHSLHSFRGTPRQRAAPWHGVKYMNKKGPQNISPIDWYLGSYISRFIEIEDVDNGNQEKMFSAWENTVIVQADSLKKAYEKIEIIGKDHAEPYTNVDQKLSLIHI